MWVKNLFPHVREPITPHRVPPAELCRTHQNSDLYRSRLTEVSEGKVSHLSAELQLVRSATTAAAASCLRPAAEELNRPGPELDLDWTGHALGLTGLRPVPCVRINVERRNALLQSLCWHKHWLPHSFSSMRGGGRGGGLYHLTCWWGGGVTSSVKDHSAALIYYWSQMSVNNERSVFSCSLSNFSTSWS